MRMPFPTTLRNRSKSRAKDARILNGMVDKRRAVVKRPSLNASFSPVAVGPGLGLFVKTTPSTSGTGGVGEELIAISNDVLTQGPTTTAFRLRFSVQPATSNINTAGSPTVTVQVIDRFGDVVTGSSATITLTLTTNPTGATLGGTTSKAATAGVAAFTDLTVSRSGENFKLTASASFIQSTVSNQFSIPTVLTFTTQPSTVAPDATFTVVVAARDSAGNTDTNYGGEISLSLYTGAGSGILDGITTRTATNGVATFSGLSITEEATYSLLATGTADPLPSAYKPSNRISNTFSVATSTHTVNSQHEFDDPNNYYGWNGVVGSITPTTFNGIIIDGIYSQNPGTGSPAFVFILRDPSLAQNYFTSIVTSFGTLLTSAASHVNTGTQTFWTWTGEYWGTTTGNISVTIS